MRGVSVILGLGREIVPETGMLASRFMPNQSVFHILEQLSTCFLSLTALVQY